MGRTAYVKDVRMHNSIVGIVTIALGILAGVRGVTAKKIYPGRGWPNAQPMPFWLGRTLCLVTAAVALWIGFLMLSDH